MYAQDPAYTAADKAVLRDVGVEVLEDPRGFLEVNRATVVLSIGPDFPLKQVLAADIARPAVIVWEGVWGGGRPPRQG